MRCHRIDTTCHTLTHKLSANGKWYGINAVEILSAGNHNSLKCRPTNIVGHEVGEIKTLHRQSFTLIEQTEAHIIIGLFLYKGSEG